MRLYVPGASPTIFGELFATYNKKYLVDYIDKNGAQGRDRTTDTAIFSRMLYQLSYLGTAGRKQPGAAGL